ncbi:hypothetical protein NB701_004431 [Pantoea ananatis]|nr:hypothetical protein [Pantoea ananatis]
MNVCILSGGDKALVIVETLLCVKRQALLTQDLTLRIIKLLSGDFYCLTIKHTGMVNQRLRLQRDVITRKEPAFGVIERVFSIDLQREHTFNRTTQIGEDSGAQRHIPVTAQFTRTVVDQPCHMPLLIASVECNQSAVLVSQRAHIQVKALCLYRTAGIIKLVLQRKTVISGARLRPDRLLIKQVVCINVPVTRLNLCLSRIHVARAADVQVLAVDPGFI